MLQLVIIIIFREMNIFRWTTVLVFSAYTNLYPHKKNVLKKYSARNSHEMHGGRRLETYIEEYKY